MKTALPNVFASKEESEQDGIAALMKQMEKNHIQLFLAPTIKQQQEALVSSQEGLAAEAAAAAKSTISGLIDTMDSAMTGAWSKKVKEAVSQEADKFDALTADS
ncbi:hypothetical protein [Streptococcus pantholopis]|uniref:Uncharacterized protein n=1 Tax=Streptococcus pantholopis TaxID=1811193 RepID=A0A172Q9P5_9STRE|nr:hypothetical protein [Streptococcus pantholopis]AND80152.1 hypothetical protein A0O21_09135 [Streptococcus pantholopis]